MRRTITVKPVVIVWLRLLAPGCVGVFPALRRQRLLTLAARRAGVGRILRYLIRRHKLIVASHIFGADPFGPTGFRICGAARVSCPRWPSQSMREALRAPGCPPEPFRATAHRAWAVV